MAYCLEAALDYARRGFSVIPISPSMSGEENRRRKNPIVRWTEWQTRAANEEQIKQWWETWPDAGVGIVTGKVSGVLVMDVDPKNGGTAEGLPPTNMVVNTGGGGQHYYYRMIDGVRNNSSQETGVDVRADGGYVVAPPSLHASGEAYAWDPDEEPGSIDVETIERLSPRSRKKDAVPSKDEGRDDKWISSTLSDGAPSGERNDTIARLAGYYAGKDIAPDIGLQNCLDANSRFNPPLDRSEVERTVRSIYEAEARNNPEGQQQALKPGQIADDADELEFIGFDDYATKYGGQEVKYLIPGFLPDATIGFFVGPPGSFKTWGEMDMAVSIAEGTPFLGLAEPVRTGPVLMFQQEDSHMTVAERIATIWFGRLGIKSPKLEGETLTWQKPESASNIHLYEKRAFRFDNPNAMGNLRKALEKFKPVAVFMDPFYSLVPVEDNMEKATEYIFGLKQLRDEFKCSFLFVHHTNKSGLGTSNRGNMWGSQFLNAYLETRFDYHNIAGSPMSVCMERRSKDGAPKEPLRIDFDIFDGNADEPGEWRFSTSVQDIDAKKLKELINPDRKLDDDEDNAPRKSRKKRQKDQPQASAYVDPSRARKESSIAKIVDSGKLNRGNINTMDTPLRDVFDEMFEDGRIKLGADGFTYARHLTLSVAGAR